VAAVVQQPRRVERMDAMLAEMEEGRLKLRVRALEVEQAVAKLDVETKIGTTIVAVTASLNAGLLVSQL
jgi:K+/H+ antiporter YhaU regulatory subunit KhtT